VQEEHLINLLEFLFKNGKLVDESGQNVCNSLYYKDDETFIIISIQSIGEISIEHSSSHSGGSSTIQLNDKLFTYIWEKLTIDNNWCKYVIITHGIREAFKQNNNRKINVLDIACGKGGDLWKFRGNKKFIALVVGIDLAQKCIDKTKRIYEQMKYESMEHRNASWRQWDKHSPDK